MTERLLAGNDSSPETAQKQRFREALLVTANMYGTSADWLEVTNQMRSELPATNEPEILPQVVSDDILERRRQKIIFNYDLDPDVSYIDAEMVDAFARDEVLRQGWAAYLYLDATASWDEIMGACPEEIEVRRPLYRYRGISSSAS